MLLNIFKVVTVDYIYFHNISVDLSKTDITFVLIDHVLVSLIIIHKKFISYIIK